VYFLGSRRRTRRIEVLEGLGSAQEALKDPQLELVELPEAHERDWHRRGAFEDVGDSVAEREVFQGAAASREIHGTGRRPGLWRRPRRADNFRHVIILG